MTKDPLSFYNQPKYRVYSLLLGQIIPEDEITGCVIRKMSFAEQEKRGFSPMKATFDNSITEEYKTYITSLPFVDPVKIKSEYVVSCDLNDTDVLAAIGGATRKMNNLCKYLFFANMEDSNKKHGGIYGLGSTYVYQIVKVYGLDSEQKEQEVAYVLNNRHCFLPNRPDSNIWRDFATNSFLQNALLFEDDVFRKALGYLYQSSIGFFTLNSNEKIALDHFKSIEIIVNDLSKKRTFLERLDEAAKVIDLSEEQKLRISKLWKERSDGDVAHSKDHDLSGRYPNQFPLPSGTDYSGAYPDSIAEAVCLKYYHYKRDLLGESGEVVNNF